MGSSRRRADQDRAYLEWHGGQWRVQVSVPAAAQDLLGKRVLRKGLGTDSLLVANRLKGPVVREFHRQIDEALRSARTASPQSAGDPLVREALEWRREVALEEVEAEGRGLVDEEGRYHPVVGDVVRDRAEEIEEREGKDRASYFYAIALSGASPLDDAVPDWLAERGGSPRGQREYGRAVRQFSAWLRARGLHGTAEAATKRMAGDYVGEMVFNGIDHKTANKAISALSAYWKWLGQRGRAEVPNIWQGQSLKKKQPTDEPAKRPFTNDEVRTLLVGISDPLLADAMRVAALTGMRVGELGRLQVTDCKDDTFHVRRSKTEAGRNRRVPQHPALRELVRRRSEGKDANALLFHELPLDRDEPEQIISKRFTRRRRDLGVDDRVPGARQSRIDFHSFRRWFIATARDAFHAGARGFDLYTIADVVGHDRENAALGLSMTMGRYAGGARVEAMRACVEAVQLPTSLPLQEA